MEIYENIKQEIISGVMAENSRLPSIRKLAEFLAVSATPVELAYQQLIAEGFVESRPRKGYYVAKLPEPYGTLGGGNVQREAEASGQSAEWSRGQGAVQNNEPATGRSAEQNAGPTARQDTGEVNWLGAGQTARLSARQSAGQTSGPSAVQTAGQTASRSQAQSAEAKPAPQPAREYTYDFHLSKNDFSLFPFSVWKKLHHQLFRPENADLLFYGEAQGELGLRTEVAGYLRQFRGVVCDPSRIVIAAEQHVLVHHLALLLQTHTDCIAFEDPGYRIIPATFRAAGYRAQPVALDENGLRPDLLRHSAARVVSVSPSHQFPMGMVMPVGRRLELLEWAKAVDGYILEDDYGGEFRYQGRPIPSLQGLVPNHHVIYLGGFSQVLAPDFCIHYMVLPERLAVRYHDLRRDLMFEASSSRTHQRVLERFIKDGYFERHVRRMRNLYRKKNRQLCASIERHFGEYAVIRGDSAGLHVVLQVCSSLPEAYLLGLAQEAGIRVASAAFFWNPPPETVRKSFMVGFSGIPLERIDEGIALLQKVWSPYMMKVLE
ncbi:PLP-dependent aminotransferase family protein [Paenibacillus sp. CN-4]|uniref:MocR-like pyridoxine biosynthesis transcription factor PdxR n=1 Tax=Paenibacillus nanchangensis TaxID=3348343 RepID=UPI00397BFAF4